MLDSAVYAIPLFLCRISQVVDGNCLVSSRRKPIAGSNPVSGSKTGGLYKVQDAFNRCDPVLQEKIRNRVAGLIHEAIQLSQIVRRVTKSLEERWQSG